MELLLHICCAPCSIYPVERLREMGYNITGYFYNPNIHPYQEFKRRRETLKQYAALINLEVIYENDYPLTEFLKGSLEYPGVRCGFCYETRLEKSFQKAKSLGINHVSTTLLVSPYQKHDLIKEIGLNLAEKYGLNFVYEDFCPGYRAAYQKAKELDLYRQPYCGCIFSEKERYYKEGK
ncbi:epoxyqueuosine reductase QueH [Carboxydothermus hydrogenoformans]|uniref:Epoxyqueuosine reductase QueH n=1 Tax=Carboxydothermus hydrogenoformans (strain ATCC BAA-161 / DSM 6008 / Z-2901) TaxID=246194 RepID=Q3ABY1_CARHZ|nr:epoxyqueuosine reductase QueH [Carboxydothermus hydrogenoformans]ABB14029.1 conserved hypothetical protein [Carboxydothermus hydrogenoformans Z-2901]